MLPLFAALPAAQADELCAEGDLFVSAAYVFDPSGPATTTLGQFDGQTGELVRLLALDQHLGARDLTFGPNGNLFAASDTGETLGSVLEYDGNTGALVGTFVAEGAGGFDDPGDITFGPNGNLFVGHWGNPGGPEILQFDGSTGAFIGVFVPPGGGGLGGLRGLTFGPNGNLFVASQSPTAVLEYDGQTGAPLGTFASGGGLNSPQSLTFGPDGHLYVVSGQTSSYVLRFDGTTGAPLGTFINDWRMDYGRDLAFGPSGNLFICEKSNYGGSVLEYDGQTGAFVRRFVDVNKPVYLAFKPCPGALPQVAGFSPAQADDCGRLWDATITGDALWHACMVEVKLTRAGQPDIVGIVTGGSGASEVTAHFELAGVASGAWDLTVVNAHGDSATLPNALTVVSPACPPPVISAFSSGYREDMLYNCPGYDYACEGAPSQHEAERRIITGSGFQPGATALLTLAGEPDIIASRVDVESPETAFAWFDLDEDVPPGTYDLVVLNPDAQAASWPIQIEACPRGRVGDLYVCNDYGRNDGNLPHTQGCLCGELGNWVQCNFDGNVVQFDGATGEFICTFAAAPGMAGPIDLVWGPNGNLFVCDGGKWWDNGRVTEFDGQTGQFIRTFVWEGSGGLYMPRSLDFGGPDANLYVLDAHDDLYEFDRQTGAFIRVVTSLPSHSPNSHTLKFGPDGSLYVGGGCVWCWVLQEYDPVTGDQIRNVVEANDAEGIVYERDTHTWLLGNDGHDTVIRYDFDSGNYREALVLSPGIRFPGVLKFTSDLAYGPNGNLFVSGTETKSLYHPFEPIGAIHEYDGTSFEQVRVFGYGHRQEPEWDRGPHPGELYHPRRMAFKPLPGDYGGDGAGGDWRVNQFDLGKFQEAFGGAGIPSNDARALIAFDFDRDGDIDCDDYAAFRAAFEVSSGYSPILPTDEFVALLLGSGGDELAGCMADINGDGQADGADIQAYVEALLTQPPFGACCRDLLSGDCTDVPEAECSGYYQGDGTTCATAECPVAETVYANEDDSGYYALSGSGLMLADDLTLAGTARELVAYRLTTASPCGPFGCVSYDLTVSLYTGCPGEGGELIPGTTRSLSTVAGVAHLEVRLDTPVLLPETVWMVAAFSRSDAGWIISNGAEVGFTADRIGQLVGGAWDCNLTLTGFYGGLAAALLCVEDSGIPPDPVGACCRPSGDCVECAAADCDQFGGVYQGDGTTCDTASCPTGACCLQDGTCVDVPGWACTGDYQGDGTDCASTVCPGGRYSNTIDPMTTMALAGAGLQIADDMTLDGVGFRDLVFLDLRVYGGNSGGGTFDVTISLYTDCPGTGGTPIPPIVDLIWSGVPDDGYVYTLAFSGPPVTIPDTVWMVATFTTPESGWIIAEEAEIGFTEDRYGWLDPWDCNRTFSSGEYAGLWANLRCEEGGGKAGGGGRSSGPGQASELHMIRVDTDAAPVAVPVEEVTR